MKILLKYLFFVFVLSKSGFLLAQNGQNPFELKHRKEPAKTETADTEKTDARLIKTDNPFDVVDQPMATNKVTKSIPILGTKKAVEEPVEGMDNYLFWVFFILFAFLTAVIAVARKRLEQSYQAFLNDNYLRQLHRVNQGSFSLSYFLLYLLFFLNAGIFIFLSANHFGAKLTENFSTVALICLGVGIAFLIKHLLLFFVQNIFPISKEIKLYSFMIMVFSIILGIVLLPINTLIAFAPENFTKIAVWGGLGAIIVTYIFRSLRGLSIGSRYLMLHSFHFLLYLCAVEILPVIVLLKFILLRIH